MQVEDPSVVEDGESRAEFMALLKYLTRESARRVREMRCALPFRRACGMQKRGRPRPRPSASVRVRYFHMMHHSFHAAVEAVSFSHIYVSNILGAYSTPPPPDSGREGGPAVLFSSPLVRGDYST